MKYFWAEFYNPSHPGGIRFKITQVSLVGDILRLELYSKDKRLDDCWHFVEGSPFGGFTIGGKHYTDFGCSATPCGWFDELDPLKLEGLVRQ